MSDLTELALQRFYASDFVEKARVQLWLSYAEHGGLVHRPLTQLDELLLPTFLQLRRESLRQYYTARITVTIVCPIADIPAHTKQVRPLTPQHPQQVPPPHTPLTFY